MSYEIWANLNKAYEVNGQVIGTVLSVAAPFMPVRKIKPTYAFTGNQFLGYVRDRGVVSPLVGMTTGVTPLPRPLPDTNYNFQILGALGLQVKKDAEGLGGVIYGANLA
ncbi:hypothetical protein FG99_00085 [Pseudomonas sp. AAC]|nr:hypothetical protein FG99_00085 [Pseudomonas sp. AAC]